jgi:hypothetical protein
MEAYDRGPAWKDALNRAMEQLKAAPSQTIKSALTAGITKLGREPIAYGLPQLS